MPESKHCPLCGKPLNDENILCDDCQNHVDHQYATEFLDTDENQKNDLVTKIQEIAISGDNLNENTTDPVIPPLSPIDDEKVENVSDYKRKTSKGIIFLLAGCILLVIIGAIGSWRAIENRKSIENEDKFWTNCIEENTPLAYSKYLVAFVDGRYVDEANKRIRDFREAEVRAWKKLKKSSDINDFYAYLSENPKTPHINQIRTLMDSLSWLETTKDNTADAYKAYLENVNLGNLSGKYVDEAQEKFTYLSEIVILEGSSLDSLKTQVLEMYRTLSERNPKNLLKLFSSTSSYYGKEMSSTEIVAALNNSLKENKIKNIVYAPKSETIRARKDNKGIIFIDLTVNKEIVYNTKIKKGKKTEYKKENTSGKVYLELDVEGLIRLIK